MGLIMETGIFDISIEDYHSSEGISKSGLSLIKRSPYHYYSKYLAPDREVKEPTPALAFGNALHTMILEPDTFGDRYYVMPKADGRTKEGKAIKIKAYEEAENKIIITQEDMALLWKMTNAANRNPEANELLSKCQYEKSIYWQDKVTQAICKVRPDAWGKNLIVDLKTTNDASQNAFSRDVFTYNYHVQAAMIREGIFQTIGQDITNFVYVAIEKDPPYAIGIFILHEDVLNYGHKVFKENLQIYKSCLDKNEWPGYAPTVINLPSYYTI